MKTNPLIKVRSAESKQNMTLQLGVIGGSLNSAVGRTHQIAAEMDNRWEITAGCFSRNADTNQATARLLRIPDSRNYRDWRELLESEQGRLSAVAVLTPTPSHAEIICQALELGYPVISEKALTSSVEDGEQIIKAREACNGFLTVTYNYSGYPIVRELRNLIRVGRLGTLLHVQAEMPQEGFLRLVGRENRLPEPQPWRLQDYEIPTVSLDLGVHLHQLILFLTDRHPLQVCATQQNSGLFAGIVDSVQCLARYNEGLTGNLWYGKCALGCTNGLRIRIFGSQGSAEWYQQNPEELRLHDNLGGTQILTRASNGAEICCEGRYGRFKAGHPSGFIEAFANYYTDVADALQHCRGPRAVHEYLATAEDAVEGLRMMAAINRSAESGQWEPVWETDWSRGMFPSKTGSAESVTPFVMQSTI